MPLAAPMPTRVVTGMDTPLPTVTIPSIHRSGPEFAREHSIFVDRRCRISGPTWFHSGVFFLSALTRAGRGLF
ncbi:hypothetical protein MHY1_02356 [Methylovirgula sp. HY1]|nr:hypothetical protein MHY1_02356 [Methylovirgula sp. HY1]